MKYAEKMVLIPESEYHMLLNLKNSQSKGSEVQTKMKQILKGKRDHEASKKMSQLVGEYIRYNQKQPKKHVKREQSFLPYFPPTYHQKVTLLMTQLKDNGLGWTDKNEFVLSSGEVIYNSNIVDLMKEALVGSRKKERESVPHGWKEFIGAIAISNIPLAIFTKRSTLQDIKQARDEKEWQVY